MTWEQFREVRKCIKSSANDSMGFRTNIECPKCGSYICMDMSMVLTSYPPQRRYFCDCGWVGSSY